MPEDIALVGFDNWEVIAAACRPPLTTVDMNLRELGRTAGEELLGGTIDGHPSSGLRRLPCSLVLRESSRPRHAARTQGNTQTQGRAPGTCFPGHAPTGARSQAPFGIMMVPC